MGMDDRAREALLEVMDTLGPDGDDELALVLVRDHWVEALEEVGAVPGIDQLRAGLLRIFNRVTRDDNWREVAENAKAALLRYPDDIFEAGPTLALTRHPAWVGLAWLELEPDDLATAVSLAAAGFRVLGASPGQGEVLWAMSEAASGVGWSDTAIRLLRNASTCSFDESDHAVSVNLLLGLSLADAGDPEADDVLEAVSQAVEPGEPSRIHALWGRAQLALERGDREAALGLLLTARDEVDPDEDPDVAARIGGALEGLLPE